MRQQRPDPHPPVDFLIITALPEERDAVLSKLRGARKLDKAEDDTHTFYFHTISTTRQDRARYQVVVTSLVSMGPITAAAQTVRAVSRWRPRYLLLVGIACGVPNVVRHGDVLIAKQIADYTLGKQMPGGREIRWEVHRCDRSLLDSVKNMSSDWRKAIRIHRPTAGEANYEEGVIASGGDVVYDDGVISRFVTDWPKLIGIEMESSGVAVGIEESPNPCGLLMIKGVSDFGKDKNDPKVKPWRKYAAHSAAAFAINLIKSGAAITRLSAGQNYSSYIQAELDRVSGLYGLTARTLTSKSNRPPYQSDLLLDQASDGAIILGTSGYGKTMLAHALHYQALLAAKRSAAAPISFYLSLWELRDDEPVFTFLKDRLASHNQSLSELELASLIRDKGAVLICDGYDEVAAPVRKSADRELFKLLRDYPQVQMFIFSKTSVVPALQLELLTLAPLSKKQQEAIVDELAQGTSLSGLPERLLSLCANPLLLVRIVSYWMHHNVIPRKIELLFEFWLESSLARDHASPSEFVGRTAAMTALAFATTNGKISASKALDVVQNVGETKETFDFLIESGALRVERHQVRLHHDALADYLRAKDIAESGPSNIQAAVATVPISADSWFSVLLLALLPSANLQKLLWSRLSDLNLDTYFDVLRYRFDVSSEITQEGLQAFAINYLTDLLDGVVDLTNGFFPSLRAELMAELVGHPATEIAITGSASLNPATIGYSFLPADEHSPRVGLAEQNSTILRFRNLDLSGFRPDSGRLLGAVELKQALLQVIENRRLKGSLAWVQERMLGRLSFLGKELGFPLDGVSELSVIKNILGGTELTLGPAFSGQDVLDDIAFLEAAGLEEIRPWWLPFEKGFSESSINHDALSRVLDEYYRRAQQCFTEIVQINFSEVAHQFRFHSMLPVRWTITIVKQTTGIETLHYRWMPVASWVEAGADVEFSDVTPIENTSTHYENVLAALQTLGRWPRDPFVFSGWKSIASFDWDDSRGDETLALRTACHYLTTDLEYLFHRMPKRD